MTARGDVLPDRATPAAARCSIDAPGRSHGRPAAGHSHRDTIFVEEGTLLARQEHPGRQYVVRIQAPRCAAAARPGSFAHLTCDPGRPMRRPLSLMRANGREGWIDILYKVVGPGLDELSRQPVGAKLSVLGPIGQGFVAHAERPRALLVGGGVGIPPMVFLAETLKARGTEAAWQPVVLMGSEIGFPFRARPSTILVPGMPAEAIACMPLLDDWGVASRLASLGGFAGCYHGYVTDLAAHWLASLDATALGEVAVFACGPTPMLQAMARVARRFGVPCQVSLEEFMACAVGGCAGCAVPVVQPDGSLAMKRVCVDGPVFDANAAFPPAA
jgi:dihydroorotate dehydrogenase electron transfer subunit